ncbi:MAG: hypothetical protein V1702_03015 [Candidatus Woesearchaeota archaeon]
MKKKHRRLSGEVKVIGGVIAVLVLAYAFQVIFTPSSAAPTGLAVAETPYVPPSDSAPKNFETPKADPIRIISPAEGSIQSPGFTVTIAIGSNTAICYYRTDDNDQLTWDRRMRPCTLELAIGPEFCKTKGANTCKVYAEAADANGNILGSDTAYFSLQ